MAEAIAIEQAPIAPSLKGLAIGEARRVAKKRCGATLDVKLVASEDKPLHVTRQFPEEGDELNEKRVNQGFLTKITRVAASIPFARDAVSVWYCARDPKTPTAAKGVMLAALAYFVLPTDVFPDFLGIIGFTDDAAVFAALITLVGRHLRAEHREAADVLLAKLRAD